MTIHLFKQDPVENSAQALQRARTGAAWLDHQFGPGWDHKINVDRLSIRSPLNCILGQLIRKGHPSLILFGGLQQAIDYGFSCGIYDALFWLPLPALNRSYRRLTAAWKLVLSERRNDRRAAELTKRLAGDAERQQSVTMAS